MKLLIIAWVCFLVTSCGSKYWVGPEPRGGSEFPRASSLVALAKSWYPENIASLPLESVEIPQLPSDARLVFVSPTDDLQAVIDAAVSGDVLILPSGAEYRGNFILPKKVKGTWIAIISSQLSSLEPGVRVSPAQAVRMPKLVSPNVNPALRAEFGAHHYYLAGLEITTTHTSNSLVHWNLVLTGYDSESKGSRTEADLPSDLVFDRCYLHGTPIGNVRTGINLNGRRMGVFNSYLEDFHELFSDSQAILIWNGGGPYRITNNFLAGASENLMVGGTDPLIPGGVPSDIEITGNHFFKPLEWKNPVPLTTDGRWLVKNLFELKNSRRVLVAENVFENNWDHAQQGRAILFTVRNQNGSAPWSTIEDVTFVRNYISNTPEVFHFLSQDDLQISQKTQRVYLSDNLMERIERVLFLFSSRPGAPLENVVVEHNTGFHTAPGKSILVFEGPAKNFQIKYNLFTHGDYGIIGSGKEPGFSTLLAFAENYFIQGNVFIGAIRNSSAAYPFGNFHPQSLSDVRLSSSGALLPISPYAGRAALQTDPGAKVDLIRSAIAPATSGR